MRLIDSNRIKQSVTNEMIKAELNSPVYCVLECVVADIESQPTAYDVDKIIKLLEVKAEISRECWKNFDDESAFGEMNAYSTAIKIVKSGGITDE